MIWTAGRNQQLGELIAEVFRTAGRVPHEYRAVVAGGPPGADKAAALEEHGADRSQFLTISVDDVLPRMAARGVIPAGPDGPRFCTISATAVRPGMPPRGPTPGAPAPPPLAGAELVHTEAQHVAK